MSDNGLQEYSNRWNKPLRPNCESIDAYALAPPTEDASHDEAE